MSELDRRRVLKAAAVMSAAGPLAGAGRAEAAPKKVETADVVVIGSGFGGSIPAFHAADAGAKVVVLERGPHVTAASLAKEPAVGRWSRVLDVVVGDGIAVLAGNCVGGGSMHYFAVSLRAPGFAFERRGGTGHRLWPRTLDREVLDPWYERAERALPVTVMDWSDVSYDGGVFAAACANSGRTCRPVPLAVDRGRCTDCGLMFAGCQYRAKRSMTLNYLPAAEARGASIRPLHEVGMISPAQTPGHRYRLTYAVLDEETYRPHSYGAIEARTVVVAAGSMATPVLLRRSAPALGGVPDSVGRHFSPNGDQLIAYEMDLARVNAQLDLSRVEARPAGAAKLGKSITTMLMDGLDGDLPEFERFSIQDCYFPFVSSLLAAVPGLTRKGLVPSARASWLETLAMSEDDNEGRFGAPPVEGAFNRIARGVGFTSLRYHPNDNTRRAWSTVLAELADTLGRDGLGKLLPPYADTLDGGITAHPLSSCRLGDDPLTSALDDRHELRGHPGLFVTDGSAVPGALCVNPSLTIAALAERASPFVVESLAGTGLDLKYRASLPG